MKDKHAFNVLVGTEVISATTEADPKVTRYGYNKYTNSVLTELDYVTKKNNIFGVSSYCLSKSWEACRRWKTVSFRCTRMRLIPMMTVIR